jgi:two-component system, OmpR family, sensor histidine kinase VicK
LIAASSSRYLRALSKLGVVDALEQANSNRVRILILCPLLAGSESDLFSDIVSDIERYAEVRDMGKIRGSVLVVDNSKVLALSEEGIDAIAIYSENKSIVDNFGSLFDNLWMQRELLDSLIDSKRALSDTNDELQKSILSLEKANGQLEQQTKIQSDFINIAAHELRTPVMSLLLAAELLESDPEYSSTDLITVPKEQLDMVIRNAKRMKILVANLLDLAMVDNLSLHLKPERHNVEDFLSNILDEFRFQFDSERKMRREKGHGDFEIKLEIHGDDSSPMSVSFDGARISQVISNLLNNALKFGLDENQPQVSLIVEETREGITIRVKDNGKGIDPSIFPTLFTRFATTSSSGVGLGLYISKKIVEAHGGMIWAENNQGAPGATFSFTIPNEKI